MPAARIGSGMSKGITVHMVVKNEDVWVWYAVRSIEKYADTILITDTGSTDNTVRMVESIHSVKVILSQTPVHNPGDMTAVRNTQIRDTKTDWIWLVDGDEIYSRETAEEVVRAVRAGIYSCIAVRRFDLLGDVYHRQKETVGTYELYGEKGHLVTRLFNKKKLNKLRVTGDYPNEEYIYGNGASTSLLPRSDVYVTENALHHAMYLRRSSLGSSLAQMLNRNKYKVETGLPIPVPPPEVLQEHVPRAWNPLEERSWKYEVLASIISPLKDLKRRLT